ncbi:hypothetical protein AC579_2886 [Pseudocercospora musae]|uniref:Zn(2)-C6 fungal-type domain-containing protein n=1 Tax=Pseudocercospora musae TaxID=113226 RepID=A0A139ITX9_9PEZI|nr:hypothetical protein AC579_2886 [Pseudocercospora musae]
MSRWHHKSRSGCVQCRARRIKCGEEKPHCRNCVRAETADICTYRQQESGQNRRRSASTRVAEVAAPMLQAPGAPVPFTVSDLELMHHYCVSTSAAVEDEPTVASWMRNVAPTMLISHPNLVGGLLGLTAAHIAFLRPLDRPKYTTLAYQHLNHALTQSQQALKQLDSSLDAEKAGALFLTAIFTSITIQALLVVDTNQQHMTALQRFITNFRAFRGISVVFWACSIHGNGFDQNYLPPNGGDGMKMLSDQECYEMIDELHVVIGKHGEQSRDQGDVQKHAMYCAILDELRNYVRVKTIRQISTVITGSTPAQWNMFCRLLDEGDIVCSLIGLCYNVAHSNFGQKWFMGGLQHEVAKVLAARVQHAGPSEARIAEWASR